MRWLPLLILLLSACSPPTPQLQQPPAAPPSYSLTAVATAEQLPDRWWRDFGDAALNRLQQRMFSANLELRQALQRLKQLQASAQRQQSKRRPTLNLQGDLSRDSSPGVAGNSRSTRASLSLAAAYEIDLWKRLEQQEKAANLRLEAGRQDVQSLLLSLSAQLAEQYFLAVEQRAQLDLLERQARYNRDLLKIISARYRSGLATAVEVYRARQNLAALESRRPQFRSSLIQAENAIALLLGEAPGQTRVEQQELPLLQTPARIGLPADLLIRRPDLKAALLELQAADHDLAAALAAQLPAVKLSATLGRSLTRLSSGDIDGTLWNLVLGLTQPLLDGGLRQAESDRQRALRAEQLATWQSILLSALRDVENAYKTELESAEQARLLDHQLQLNQQTLALARSSYLAGLSDSRDLLNNRIAQLDIRSQQLSNQRQWLSRRISLARALGGGWMDTELEELQSR